MPDNFKSFFERATVTQPFPFQCTFAEADKLPPLVNIPTGLGKTAMVVVGWLWRRFGAGDDVRPQTPRRLVYCLPMRVLVEQTRDNAIRWLHNLGRLGGDVTFDPPLNAGQRATPNPRVATYAPSADKPGKVAVYALMGGEDEDDWDTHPEREAIIIGTQDMLLSRALNRGYAASRSRWPMQFGLLHTDCLWVFDEIQLMGSGLATTAQLEAFRRLLPQPDAEEAKNGHGCRSVWMSATLRPEWLGTVDFKDHMDDEGRIDGKAALSLSDADHANEQVRSRWNAKKPLTRAASAMDNPVALAKEVRQAHRPGTRTIVVVNTVKRACALFEALGDAGNAAGRPAAKKRGRSGKGTAPPTSNADKPSPALVLLHSRFRPPDRAKRVAEALANVAPDGPGTIVVSTQVIEAGVDVSATTLFTELAPWASLVQRFGRCNRCGEQNEQACVRWIDLPAKDAEAEKLRFPYELPDLRAAAEQLEKLTDVRLGSLAEHKKNLSKEQQEALFPHEHTHVIRRRDLIDLFDTTPDLAGNDIDIDRFVREVEDSDVRVFWRAWDRPKGHEPPAKDEPAPRREELCPVPIGEFREFAKKHAGQVWRWDFLDETWEKVDPAKITPGQVFLIHADSGAYSPDQGWNQASAIRVEPVAPPAVTTSEPLDATDNDRLSRRGVWQTIAEHTDGVCRDLNAIINALPLEGEVIAALRLAARWHDWGKGHEVFWAALPDGIPDETKLWAKAAGQWKRYGRRHFRHELASALAVLQRPHETLKALSDDDLNLVAYLVAAHHGKVRLSIRSLPNDMRPTPVCGASAGQCGECSQGGWSPIRRRFARGVWDDDELPETDLGQEDVNTRIIAPKVTLSLEPMELGQCEKPPFAGQPSWAERMIRLRDTLGPFHLAYLEAILRAADMRASAKAAERAATVRQAAAGPISSSAGASGKEGANG
ncbi:MAG: CRISPR-associated helicase/endonuclease Cas3 [Phycisphaerae bacterium]|jgi:CRISPR-associated endonuclease/helicase Cas3